jgi:hypothetical protein
MDFGIPHRIFHLAIASCNTSTSPTSIYISTPHASRKSKSKKKDFKMPIITDFPLPASPATLNLPTPPNTPFFIAFLASVEPATGKPWCPDVVAALPVLHETFSAEHAPLVAFVEVGQKAEYVVHCPFLT